MVLRFTGSLMSTDDDVDNETTLHGEYIDNGTL